MYLARLMVNSMWQEYIIPLIYKMKGKEAQIICGRLAHSIFVPIQKWTNHLNYSFQ